jgi:hypothetical protein
MGRAPAGMEAVYQGMNVNLASPDTPPLHGQMPPVRGRVRARTRT